MTATGSLRVRVPLASSIVLVLALVATGAVASLHPAAGISAPTRAVVDPALTSLRSGDVGIIVRKISATDPSPEAAVAGLGGRVTRDLEIIDGFAATVPAQALRALARQPGIRVISLDRKVMVAGDGGAGSPNSVYPKVVRSKDVNQLGVTGQN